MEDGKAVRHDIETGIQDNTNIELLSPLPEGAKVITGPYDLLSRKLEDGDAVSPSNKEENAESGSGFSVSISTN